VARRQQRRRSGEYERPWKIVDGKVARTETNRGATMNASEEMTAWKEQAERSARLADLLLDHTKIAHNDKGTEVEFCAKHEIKTLATRVLSLLKARGDGGEPEEDADDPDQPEGEGDSE
jgi:hypothetical protein